MIVILGDSLSLPRPEDGIDDTDTYAFKIAKNNIVLNKSQYGNNTKKQLSRINADVMGTHADIYIIQLGIVDCSPRIFSYRERKLLSALSLYFSRIIKKYIEYKTKNRFKKTQRKKIVYVTLSQYVKNMNDIINTIQKHNDVKKIFLINIAYPSESLKRKNYDIENIIKQYNNSLDEFKNDLIMIVDLFSYTKNNADALLQDEHISIKGHNFITKSILEEIRNG